MGWLVIEIAVVRIGHRILRDDRTTTHAALVSRALGSKKIFMTDVDHSIVKTINDLNKRWGGSTEFEVEAIEDWKKVINDWKKNSGKVIHLTMYGINIDDLIDTVQKENNILVVIGAEKVPRGIYYLADYNIAIGNQPHSEIAALAIFLDRMFEGKQFNRELSDGRMKIIPSEKGKNIITNKNRY